MKQSDLCEYLQEIYKRMNRYVYTLTMDNYEKDDIVQSTMEIVYKKCGQLRNDDKLFSWAYAIAKNETEKYFKSKNKRALLFENDVEMNVIENIVSDQEELSLLMEHDELRDSLMKIIAQLDKDQQQVIYLRHYYDMTLVDIAKVLGVNLNTIKSRYYRGLRRMRAIMEIMEEYADEGL